MTADSIPPITSGKSLFSRHYLEMHLPRQAEWAEDPGPACARLAELWARAQALGATWNESQTETEFVRPALEALGWAFIPQAAATRGGRLHRPDYALFADAAARDEAYRLQRDEPAFYGRSLAIAEAKHWGRPLSRRSEDGREQWDASTNPSHQMVNYLVGTRCPWGILTNGQTWRLYSREASSTASEFYEVDLAAVFGEDAPLSVGAGARSAAMDGFRRFWLFFRRAAFLPDAEGRNFVQRVAEGSATYAREVSDKLKELVFTEVMPEVAAGFIAFRREQRGISAETDATLAEVYRASLGLLYKLLFILYAEARGLLPVENPAYREESLARLAADFAARRARGTPLSDATHATRQYDSLLALFHRIDLGDAALGIPRYDGGLFNPNTPENRFLEAHRLSDGAVARAVYTLVYDAGQPVDYGYISVRNLGSIYEGLLENRLVMNGRERDGISGERCHLVQLVNDRGERRATGSYYTPDYIVDYIVRQTVGPVLEARQSVFEAAMARVAGLQRKLAKAADPGAIRLLRVELGDAEAAAREAFLGIRCCDPAMGSGHFLVNAVDYLTDGIIQRMQAYHDGHDDVPWAWNPIQGLIERVRREILDEMARQGIRLDPERLDDTSLLTRLVMKRCIYGVDLNRMAVELAKLSLWLHSFTVGAPLSFLDHHLRWGNSLIGADVRTVEAAMLGQTQVKKVSGESRQLARGRGEEAREAASGFQFDLFGGPFAGLLDLTTTMLQIAGRADATLADVRQSADEFTAMQAALTPYKQALDLWVSRHFGNAAAEELLTVHGADVLPGLRGERPLDARHRAAVERAHALWEEKRFFHWDLEFPEVFVDLARRDWAEDPGFDAVIGNPPYVRQEMLAPLKPHLQANYASAYHGVADLSSYFLVQGLRLLRQNGRLSYITSGTFRQLSSGEPLRQHLADRSTLVEIINFGEQKVFAEAITYPIIITLRNSTPSPDNTVLVRQINDISGLKSQEGGERYPVPNGKLAWTFMRLGFRRIFAGSSMFRLLGDILEKPIYRGLTTGLNDAFVIEARTRERLISEDTVSKNLIKPFVRGEDLRTWHQKHQEYWLILLPSGWTQAQLGSKLEEVVAWNRVQVILPAIAKYLSTFTSAAQKRLDKGDYWWELRPCTYYDAFEAPRIHSTKVSRFPMFSLSEATTYAANTSYVLPIPDITAGYYILGLLNSRVSEYFCRSVFSPKANGYYEVQPSELGRFPIPDAPTADRDAIAALALAITEQARGRYERHRQTRHRILTDLGAGGGTLNQKLAAWWALDFPGFLAQVRTAFRRDVPLRERDDWEGWLAACRAEHEQRTAEIVEMETELNARVYALFDLSPAEIKVVEESTKYRYGDV